MKSRLWLFGALLFACAASSPASSFVLTNAGSGFTSNVNATASALTPIGGVQVVQQSGFYRTTAWSPPTGKFVQLTVSAPTGSPLIHLDRVTFDVRNSATIGPSSIRLFIHDSTNLSTALQTNFFAFGDQFASQTAIFNSGVTSHLASSFTLRFQVPSAINNAEGVDLDNIVVYGATSAAERSRILINSGQTAGSIENLGFSFRLSGPSNRYVAEYSVNLTNWIPFATNVITTNGAQTQFTNRATPSAAYRFYRVRAD